jgi:putative ABC transport system permease protein
MPTGPSWRRYARFHRENPARDVDDEFAFHLSERIEALVARGVPRNVAEAEALRRFGDLASARETYVALVDPRSVRARATAFVQTWVHDTRYALRGFARARGFAAGVILTAALGIGANATVFTILDALLLRPLPVAQPDRLVRIYTSDASARQGGTLFGASSYPDYRDLRRAPSLVAAASYAPLGTSIRRGATIIRAEGRLVSESFFATLGVRPALGRLLAPADSAVDGAPAIVLTHAFWRREFASDPDVAGRLIELNGKVVRIVGVSSAQFTGLEPANVDVYLPMSSDRIVAGTNYADDRGARLVHVIGRLKPDASADRVERDANTIMRALGREYPATNAERVVTVRPVGGLIDMNRAGGPVVPVSVLLFGASALVLTIAAVNLASLVLARAVSRRREIAVRVSLGAARRRVVRQLLTESFVLAVGAELMVLAAVASLPLVGTALGMPPVLPLAVSGRVIGFVTAVTFAMTLCFGLWPAWRATSGHVFDGLRESSATPRLGRARAHRVLAGTQVALSIVLLVCAGMLVQSLRQQQAVKPGFEVTNLIAAEFEGVMGQQTRADERELARNTLDRARSLPGVRAVSIAANPPLTGDGMRMSIDIPGYQPGTDERMEIPFMIAGADYFAVLGIPIVRGVELTGAGDTVTRVVINQVMARRYWRGRDPVGSTLTLGGRGGQAVQVIGVAADARLQSLAEAPAPRFVIQNRAGGGGTLLIRTRGVPEPLIPTVQHDLGESTPAFALVRIRTMEQVVGSSLLAAKALAGAVTLVSVLALSLAVCGLYAVVSYLTAQRTREFGVRLALGADRRDLFRLVLQSGARISVVGGVIGLALSLAAGVGLRGLLFSVRMIDVPTVVAVTALMIVVVLIATLGPALRASRTSPVEPLRAE